MSQEPAHTHRHPRLWNNSALALSILGVVLATLNIADVDVSTGVWIASLAAVTVSVVLLVYAGASDWLYQRGRNS